MGNSTLNLQELATEFRDGLIGTQPRASRGMCALVSIPLRAALKVHYGVETQLVTEGGHTFLVTADGQFRIDPTIDQFQPSEVRAGMGLPNTYLMPKNRREAIHLLGNGVTPVVATDILNELKMTA